MSYPEELHYLGALLYVILDDVACSRVQTQRFRLEAGTVARAAALIQSIRGLESLPSAEDVIAKALSALWRLILRGLDSVHAEVLKYVRLRREDSRVVVELVYKPEYMREIAAKLRDLVWERLEAVKTSGKKP